MAAGLGYTGDSHMPPPFRYYLRVRYSECDAQRVVFHARYAEYVDVALTEFMRALGFGEVLASGELDCQTVKQTVEWRAPARNDQVLELTITVPHRGTTSFMSVTEIRIAGEEKVSVLVETVYVTVNHNTLEKTPLTAALREALERGAPGVIVDHAGYLAGNERSASVAV